MLSDVGLLARLRIRHARTTVLYLLHATGSDFLRDRSMGERLYQVYIVAIVGAAVALMAASFLDGAVEVFTSAGVQAATALLSVVLLAPIVCFVLLGAGKLKDSVVRMSHADIAFVAASSISLRAIIAVGCAAACIAGGAVGFVAGYVVGVCLQAGLGVEGNPLLSAITGKLLVVVGVSGSHVLGAARLVLERTWRRFVACGVLGLAGLLIASVGCVLVAVLDPLLLLEGAALDLLCASAVVLIIVEAVLLMVLAPRIDMTAVIEQNALHADLQPFGALSPLDPSVISDYRRRRKLAGRRPRFCLSVCGGRRVVVARAVLSMARQYEGIPKLLMLGASAAPLGVLALSGMVGVLGLMAWLTLMLMLVDCVRCATQAFRDDIRVRFIRDRIPFGTLELLCLNSLPAFVLVNAVSCVTIAFMPASGMSLGVGIVLVVFMNAAIFLSCGLDVIRLYKNGPRPFFEVGPLVLVAVTAACSLVSQPWLIVVGASIVCTVLALVIRSGVECAR